MAETGLDRWGPAFAAWRGWRAPSALAAGGLALGALLVWIGQELLARPELSPVVYAVYPLGLLLLVALDRAAERVAAPAAAIPHAAFSPRRSAAVAQRWLLAAILVAAVVICGQVAGKPLGGGYGFVFGVWLATLLAALLASALPLPPAGWPRRLAAAVRPGGLEGLLVGAILLGALFVRLLALDRFPYVFGGDEGSQALAAVAVLGNPAANPFGTGWWGLPSLFFVLQAASIQLFGDSVGGVRVASGLLGTLAVACTYLLARRLFGRSVAVVATALLAVFPYHLLFSRLASVQVVDTLAIVVALLFLDLGFRERQPTACVAAGLAVGLGQYGSFAGRLIPLVAAAYVLYALVRGVDPTPSTAWGERLRLAGWVVLGAALAVLPLLVYYLGHPDLYNQRAAMVNILTSSWLKDQQAWTGRGAVDLVLHQLLLAVLLPVRTVPQGWSQPGAPLVGWPLAALTALGLTLATTRALRPRYVGLMTAYWGAVLGIGLTNTPAETQRFVIAAPLLPIFAALGLDSLRRIATTLVCARPAIAGAATAAVVVALAGWSVLFYFQPPDETRYFGDRNALTATELAYYLRDNAPRAQVYFDGRGRLTYRGFDSIAFIARDAVGIDMYRPWDPADPPHLVGQTVFAVIADHVDELQKVQAWFPGGRAREFRTTDGLHLLTVYEVP